MDKGAYTLDPVHPPLTRIFIGVPLYLAGARLPILPLSDAHDACTVGNAILNRSGEHPRNLMLARIGVIPFFLLGCAVVFFWTRREFGDFAAAVAVGLFTTVPPVLAFSSIAYTDIVAGCTQTLGCWAFVLWLKKIDWRSTVWLGLAMGLAILAKATTYLFLPACGASIVVLKLVVSRKMPDAKNYKRAAKQIAAAVAIAMALLWAGYGFAIGRVQQSMQLSPDSMPSFQYFPAFVGRISRDFIRANPVLPAPALIRGMAIAWVMNKAHPSAYLLDRTKPGGYWYCFLVVLAVKSPIPFLLLVAVGLVSFKRLAREKRWAAMAPAACVLAILLVTMPVSLNAGVRHVLVVYPLLAIVAGCGCSYLWHLQGRGRTWGRLLLVVLLLWQGVSSLRASGDYLAYFNEFAEKDPGKVLMGGCDLDCGQDLFRLSRELRARHISHVSLALWTSADVSKMGLPEFKVPEPHQPVRGWFAISLRARLGEVFHSPYPADSFFWLDRYQPVDHVGKTILLYYIPEGVKGESRIGHRSKRAYYLPVSYFGKQKLLTAKNAKDSQRSRREAQSRLGHHFLRTHTRSLLCVRD
ncbi:MAG: glycosyltransferase family 39 protein [Candidatus Sulfotelmatobacter sp.]